MAAAGATAAATSHSRATGGANNGSSSQQDGAKRRAALQRQRERRRVRAAAVFDKYQDGLTGTMQRDKLGTFLQDVMRLETAVDPKAVKVVEDAAAKQDGGNLKKAAVLEAVEHYGEYVKHAAQVDALYAQFDSDGNNELSREEFQKALEQHEARQTARTAVPVTEADLDVILERADADHDGQISRAEILPALAAWEEMAAIKAEEAQEAAACCVVL